MTKVSFVLPAFKARFLKEAIASILAQTHRDFELIVVDDCSPENLKSIVDRFQDERLTYYRNETNIGGKDLVAAWEHALSYAKNDWCVLASDDDVYHPRYLEEMVKLTEKYPQVNLVHSRFAVINESGEWTETSHNRMEYETQIQMAYNMLTRRPYQVLPEFLFRKSALTACGGFEHFPLAWGSDDVTWIKLAKNGVACSREILFSFRRSGINITTKEDQRTNLEKAHAACQFYQWFLEHSPKLTVTSTEDAKTLRFLIERAVPSLRDYPLTYAYKLKMAKAFAVMNELGFGTRAKIGYFLERYPRLAGFKKLVLGR